LCESDDEEDRGQKTERGHEDLDDEDDSVMELEYADGNRGKSPTSVEGSQNVGEVPVLVDKVSDSRCEISSDTPVIYGCVFR